MGLVAPSEQRLPPQTALLMLSALGRASFRLFKLLSLHMNPAIEGACWVCPAVASVLSPHSSIPTKIDSDVRAGLITGDLGAEGK